MPKKLGTVDRDVLINAALPAATKTYTVISHTYIIDTILQELQNNGFEVTAEEFKSTGDAKVATGAFMIQFNEDPELTLCYTFNNSYDKSLRFRAAIGAYIDVNGSYMISDTDSWIRKHTGTADQEAFNLIQDHIANAREYYEELKMAKESMSEITITKAEFGGIIGEFFLKDLLSVDQISYIKKEFFSPSYNYANPPHNKTINLWTAYMIIADALKSSHPSKWMKSQTGIHLYFVTKYNLTEFDYDEATENEDPELSNYNSDEDIDITTDITESISDEDTHAEEDFVLPGFESETKPVLPCIGHSVESDKEEESEEDIPQMPEPSNETDEVEESLIDDNPLEEAFDETPVIETEELIEEPVQAETFYFMKEDYEGVEIGDYIEEAGVYYNIINDESGDDGNFWVCIQVDVESDETEEIEPEELNTEPEEIEDDWFNEQEFKGDDVTENVEEVKDDLLVVAEPTIPENVELTKVIAEEVEELYGYRPNFTYTRMGSVYNVVLETNESFTLLASAVDNKL